MPTSAPKDHCAVLAFDFGLRAIGVAAGHSPSGASRALKSVRARDGAPDWHDIQARIEDWHPQTLVIGLPLNMDGSESEMSARARRFARQLEARFRLPCELIDERLSSAGGIARAAAATTRTGGARRRGAADSRRLAAAARHRSADLRSGYNLKTRN